VSLALLAPVLASVHGVGELAEKLGVIAVASMSAVVVLGRGSRPSRHIRTLAMLLTLILTPVLLVVDIWGTSQMVHLRDRPALALAAICLGLALVGAVTVVVLRRPQSFPVLAILALPFRLPISTGGTTSNLLIPLYLVVAAGAIAHLLQSLSGESERASESPAAPAGAGALHRWCTPVGVARLLMASVVLYGVQATYSADFSKALENMVFFYVPFALLFALLLEVRWTRQLLMICLGTAVGLAVTFAGIGFIEYYRKSLFLNPKVLAADKFGNYFRVNSLFFDPNIYGRFLALVMLMAAATTLWSSRRRTVLIGGVVLAWLLAGLITSFSQSSIAALLLGLAILAALRWDVRATIYVSLAILTVAAVTALAAPPSLHLGLAGKGGSASNATSGRTKLIEGGLGLFADRPLEGFGSGSFAQEYLSHEHVSSDSATSASHTIPITVAAEQGIVGLALYVALLVAAFGMLFSRIGRSPPRIALAACFAALVLHTFTYADFLEDPLTWTLLGIGAALYGNRRQEDAPSVSGRGLAEQRTPAGIA
jgi:putative inorganic carbon (HCO3(-)) transporter